MILFYYRGANKVKLPRVFGGAKRFRNKLKIKNKYTYVILRREKE